MISFKVIPYAVIMFFQSNLIIQSVKKSSHEIVSLPSPTLTHSHFAIQHPRGSTPFTAPPPYLSKDKHTATPSLVFKQDRGLYASPSCPLLTFSIAATSISKTPNKFVLHHVKVLFLSQL